jgi:hypothetical protein
MHEEVLVTEIPPCDFCGEPAIMDGKTKAGPWAYMCSDCARVHSVGIGLGRGQKLVLK